MTPGLDKYAKIADEYESIGVQQFAKFPKDKLEFIQKHINTIEGHPMKQLLPQWSPIYMDYSHNKFILAARQTGKSTYIGIDMLWYALTNQGATLAYVTYDETNLSHYSNQKFRRGIIMSNLAIRMQLTKNERGEVAFKNAATIFLVTDEGEYKHVEGTSASVVKLDESQYHDFQFFPIFREAMSYVLGKMDILGRGGESGSAYEEEWTHTTQSEYVFDDPGWRKKLKFGKKEDGGYGLIEGPYLQEICKGHYKPRKPENNLYPGYHLPQDIFPHIPLTINDAINLYRLPPEFSIEWKRKNYPKQLFQAHVMAEFYKASRRPITPEMVLACMKPYSFYRFLTADEVRDIKAHYGNKCTILMGVDWGSSTAGNSSTVITILIKIVTGRTDDTARYFMCYHHVINRGEPGEPDMGVEEAYFVSKLFREYECDMGVADLGYGEIQVRAIQEGGINPKTNERFPGLGYSKFLGCRTIRDVIAPERDKPGKVDAEIDEITRIEIDKTHSIDNFIDFLGWYVTNPYDPENDATRRPKLMIPYEDEYAVYHLVKEWTKITRKDLEQVSDIQVEDPRQVARKEYNHPPDSAMSVIYCLEADGANMRKGGSFRGIGKAFDNTGAGGSFGGFGGVSRRSRR